MHDTYRIAQSSEVVHLCAHCDLVVQEKCDVGFCMFLRKASYVFSEIAGLPATDDLR